MFHIHKNYKILVQEVPKQLLKALHISKFSKFTLDKHKIQSTVDFQMNSSLVLLLSTPSSNTCSEFTIKCKLDENAYFTSHLQTHSDQYVHTLLYWVYFMYILHQIQSYNIITHFLQQLHHKSQYQNPCLLTFSITNTYILTYAILYTMHSSLRNL